MEIQNSSRRCPVNWCDLPIEVIHLIARFLCETNDVLNFGAVCKEWHTAFQISTFLPHTLAFDVSKKLISSSVFVLFPPNPTHVSPWMVLVSETTKGTIQYFSPFSRTLITHLPETFDHNQCQHSKLATTFHIVANHHSQTPFSSHFGMYTKLSPLCPLVRSLDQFCLGCLSDEGEVNEIWPFKKTDHSASTLSKNCQINDVVEYKGNTYALCKSGGIRSFGTSYSHDHGWCSMSKGCGSFAQRKRLVVSSSRDILYSIVPIRAKGSVPTWATRQRLIVYELSKNRKNSWAWSEVDNFGDSDEVLFITRDFCFFVAAAKFPNCKLKNCIVFSDDAFPICSKPWDYEGKIGNQISVFKLDGDCQYSLPSTAYSGLQNICSTFAPCWVSLDANFHLQSDQSQRIPDNDPDFSKQIVGSDANSTPVAASTLKQNRACCSVTVNFEGVEINSELLPTLQAIWAKHGSLIGNETVRSKPILACVLESLARLMITLQNTTGRSLTDSVLDDITSTFSDLQRLGLKVNWLAAAVEKALNVHKSKLQIESLLRKIKRKAQIDKEEREFLAHTTKEKQLLEDDIAYLRARVPLPVELIDHSLGNELLQKV